MNKLTILLLEDRPVNVRDFKQFLGKTLPKNSYTLYESVTVQDALESINEVEKIDIVFADLLIPGNKTKDAGKSIIFEAHKKNDKTFSFIYSNQMNDIGSDVRDELDAMGMVKGVNYDVMFKTLDPAKKEDVEKFRAKLFCAIERWTKFKCLQISDDERSEDLKKKLKGSEFKWGGKFKFDGEEWILEDLFLLYKSAAIKKGLELFKKIAEQLIEFPVILPEVSKRKKNKSTDSYSAVFEDSENEGQIIDRWNKGNEDFALGLKEYYIEFYFNHSGRLKKMEADAEKFLNWLYDGYIKGNKDSKDECTKLMFALKNRDGKKGFKYSAFVPDFKNHHKYHDAIEKFHDRLFGRLLILGGFIYLMQSTTDILEAMTLTVPKKDELIQGINPKDEKTVMRFFFIKGFKDNKVFDEINDEDKLDRIPPRRQALILKYCSGDEKRFLKAWWEKLDKKENLSKSNLFKKNLEYTYMELPS